MPIDKVASTPGNPVFGLSPEALKSYSGVLPKPWIVAGPTTFDLPRNPNLKYVYNPYTANVFDALGREKDPGVTGVNPELYRTGGLLYQKPPVPPQPPQNNTPRR